MYNSMWYYKGDGHDERPQRHRPGALGPQGQGARAPVYDCSVARCATPADVLLYTGRNHFVEPGRPLSDQYAKLLPDPPVPGSLEVADWRTAARELVFDQGFEFLKLHFKIGGKLDLSGARYRNRVVGAHRKRSATRSDRNRSWPWTCRTSNRRSPSR